MRGLLFVAHLLELAQYAIVVYYSILLFYSSY
jgi:hypothetical protein